MHQSVGTTVSITTRLVHRPFLEEYCASVSVVLPYSRGVLDYVDGPNTTYTLLTVIYYEYTNLRVKKRPSTLQRKRERYQCRWLLCVRVTRGLREMILVWMVRIVCVSTRTHATCKTHKLLLLFGLSGYFDNFEDLDAAPSNTFGRAASSSSTVVLRIVLKRWGLLKTDLWTSYHVTKSGAST